MGVLVNRDIPDQESDFKIACHVLNLRRYQRESLLTPFNNTQLREYIYEARAKEPKFTNHSRSKLLDFYRKPLKKTFLNARNDQELRGITVRKLESIVRLSEAFAKSKKRDKT